MTEPLPDATEPMALVPLLLMEEGPPDAAAVATWHLALSNLIGPDLPHDLLALWVFPDRGGVCLLAPTELSGDHLDVTPPTPFLSQHQLFALEERLRQAGYQSVVAIPVRAADRDVGLALFAALRPGQYGAAEAVRLHHLVRHLTPDFVALAAAPPLPPRLGERDDASAPTLAEQVAMACASARTGPDALRLLTGVLQGVLPQVRVEVALPGPTAGRWTLLSGAPEGRRWGEPTLVASEAVERVLAFADSDGTLLIDDLRMEQGLAWPSHRDTRAIHRVRSIAGVRLDMVGSPAAWLLVGAPAPGMFSPDDRALLARLAPVVALRVQALGAALDAEVTRAQSQAVGSLQARAGRIAAVLATTAHWGESIAAVATEVQSLLGYRGVRFAVRLGEDRVVEVEAGDVRPLSGLAAAPIETLDLAGVLAGSVPFLVFGEEGRDLAVPLRVAGRIIGALELLGGAPGAAGHPVTAAQLVADLLAPHLELLRRSALPSPLAGRPSTMEPRR